MAAQSHLNNMPTKEMPKTLQDQRTKRMPNGILNIFWSTAYAVVMSNIYTSSM